MQILTEVGEVGVHVGNTTLLLRPSLHSMSRLGDPAEIIETYGRVMDGNVMDALGVIFACTEDDVSDLFGWVEAKGGASKFAGGRVPPEHVVAIGQCLVKHGITGALDPLPRRADKEPEYVTRFVARDHVATAMAHLGLSEREAWNMTMTGLIAALRAKFPISDKDSPGGRAPTLEEHEATDAWYDTIKAARMGIHGAH